MLCTGYRIFVVNVIIYDLKSGVYNNATGLGSCDVARYIRQYVTH